MWRPQDEIKIMTLLDDEGPASDLQLAEATGMPLPITRCILEALSDARNVIARYDGMWALVNLKDSARLSNALAK